MLSAGTPTAHCHPYARRAAATSGPNVIVLSNRAPFHHVASSDGRTLLRQRSASGLVTAVEPFLSATAGTWVARGLEADFQASDDEGRVMVESDSSSYRLKYVSIDSGIYDGFYNGFANEALWPLCHQAGVSPVFRSADFARYRVANRRFAAAVVAEAGETTPLVFVQDYHFSLAPRCIRRALPRCPLVSFWHIPWPHPRVFRTCPWSRQLLEGLLGSDLIGLQTDDDCRHFLDAITLLLGADVDYRRSTIHYRDRTVRVAACPVGVQWDPPHVRGVASPAECRRQVRESFGLPDDVSLVVGVDRLDYTKGLAEKCAAVETLLERRPDLRRRLVLLQVGEPSRLGLEAYRHAREKTLAAVARVNERFGDARHRPIVFLERHFDARDVCRFYRAADVCYVNSLHDGMNLVAKEFVAARDDARGVLILSEFAGASAQLKDALLVNPFAVERSARTLERALQMPADEQTSRMRAMRRSTAAFDVTWWTGQLLQSTLAGAGGNVSLAR